MGAVLFSGFVTLAFRSGLVYAARKPDGTLKEKVPLKGLAAMASILLVIVGFFLTANYVGLVRAGPTISLGGLFVLNCSHYLLLFAFDTFVIDGYVLARWRPGFLRLSEQLGRESMREHILRSIPVGLGSGLLLAGIVSVVTFYMFLN